MPRSFRTGDLIFLACLPCFLSADSFKAGILTAFLTGGGFLFTVFVFKGVYRLLPARLYFFAIVFWLTVLAQCAWYITGLEPFWILGTALLGSAAFSEIGLISIRDAILYAIKFIVLFSGLVIFQIFGADVFAIETLQLPAFTFFFLGIVMTTRQLLNQIRTAN